ncbi:PREDICTED: protein FAM26F [Phaethon lepturus]|uniref:protein FAM26F n=1 Tax=Phaethon lepturus TaxID=97097 RepID=UPI000530536F|nr:PREDICTED: protein FAM26F [Phaethon lepturus]
MDKLREALDFCIRHQTVLGYSVVSLLTAISEHIFSSVLFKCPCNSGNMLYGLVFLLVPAFILFLLGYLMNPRTRHLLTGTCSQRKCRLWGTRTEYCLALIPVTARASVAPLTWVAVALLRASFYECAASGNGLIKNLVCKDKGQECHKLLVKIPCDQKLSEMVSSEFLSLQAQSQVVGWLLIASIMAVALIARCASHCCSPVSYPRLTFWEIYLKKEEELFKIEAKKQATKLAERNINCFFEGTAPAQFQSPSSEDWQSISYLYTFSEEEQYYSMMHKHVSTKEGNNVRPREGDQNPTALETVDEASASESGF